MKNFKSLLIFAALLISVSQPTMARNDVVATIKENGIWGVWGKWQYCPAGSFASGYAMKVEPEQKDGDDTAVNGIRLFCTDKKGNNTSEITSKIGPWGSWRQNKSCRIGHYLQSAGMSFEPDRPDQDDTATNSIRFKCTSNNTIQAHGTMPWGKWGPFKKCPNRNIAGKSYQTVISGLRTRVEPSIDGDDTALNGYEFTCSILY